jgi:hypothetical protein
MVNITRLFNNEQGLTMLYHACIVYCTAVCYSNVIETPPSSQHLHTDISDMKQMSRVAACLLGLPHVLHVAAGGVGVGDNMNCEGGFCANNVETTLRALRNDLWWLMEHHNCNPLMIRLAFHVKNNTIYLYLFFSSAVYCYCYCIVR